MQLEFDIEKYKKVRQANTFIESPYSQEFTAHEIKLFEIAISECRSDDLKLFNKKTDKNFRYTAKQLAELLNTSSSMISQEADRLTDSIMKKYISQKIIKDDGTLMFEKIGIMPYAKYENGILEFYLNYRLLPYFIDVNKNFTEYQLHYLLSMSSSYAIKLYKLLYQYKNIKSRTFTINELKQQFGLADKYPLYGSFKQKVIDPSIIQINKKTDLQVSFNEIKIGRSVEKIAFNFNMQDKPIHHDFIDKAAQSINIISPIKVQSPQTSIMDNVLNKIDKDITTETKGLINAYYNQNGMDYIEASITYARKNAKTNFDKYLADTLTKGWAEVEIKKSKAIKISRISKSASIKDESEKRKLEKDQNNNAKLKIEQEWYKLLDSEKLKYLSYSEIILEKYAEKLASFSEIDKKLPLCIYAINSEKSYNHVLEGYLKKVLNLSLAISN